MGENGSSGSGHRCSSPYPTPPSSAEKERSRERAKRVWVESNMAMEEPTRATSGASRRRSFDHIATGSYESDASMSPPSLESAENSPHTPPETPLFTPIEDRHLSKGPVAGPSRSSPAKRPAPPPISTGWTPPLASAERFVTMTAHTTPVNGRTPFEVEGERRKSIYLPLSAEPQNAPVWPLFPPDTGALPVPKSPSAIHPSYGLPSLPDHDLPPLLGKRAISPQLPLHEHKRSDEAPSRPFYTSETPIQGLLNNPTFRKTMDSPVAWLALYFLANLGLTLYNKVVLVRFPFPWTLTAVHTLCGSIGARIALRQELFTQSRLTTRENMILLGFSSLYTINIAVSNLSLHLVTVPFHQVVRAMTPLFTIAVSMLFLRKRYSRNTYLSLVPIIAGVAFATYGDYYFTMWGLILTLLGTLLAALKTVLTNIIQVGRLKLHPLDLLLRMSPLAFMQCVTAAWWTGELERVRAYGAVNMTSGNATALLVNGILAFLLNVVSFSANKKTSPLTMTVAANVKQVLTILLAVMMFHLRVTGTNLVGIVLTLGGGMLYAGIEFQEKRRKASRLPSTSPLATVSIGTTT